MNASMVIELHQEVESAILLFYLGKLIWNLFGWPLYDRYDGRLKFLLYLFSVSHWQVLVES